MSAKGTILALVLVSLTACVTEGPQPVDRSDVKGPVEVAHDRIDQHVAEMARLSGRELLKKIQIVIRYKELALEPVLKALPEATPGHKANLIYCLGFIGGPEARAAVVSHLGAKETAVGYEAAAALVTMGDWSGVPRLIDLLGAENRRLRYKAIQVLEGLAGQDLGYDFSASSPAREQAIGRWKNWWEKRRRDMIMGN